MAQSQLWLPQVAFAFAVASSAHSQQLITKHRLHLSGLLLTRYRSSRTVVLSAASNDAWSKPSASIEYSENANEDLLIFLFQLDLATRLQRAMNQNHYEVAQAVREKIAEVQNEVAKRSETKKGTASAKAEVQDIELSLLRLRSQLSACVENEDYAGAARLKEKISKLEADSLAASAKAAISQNVKYLFRLGQKLRHRIYGYRGVVCGLDPVCCESDEWVKSAKIDELPRGRNQPFYQVLVDAQRERDLITYVAEDNLKVPEKPDLKPLNHPYLYFLFYGMDAAGDYIPAKELREKYDAPRHEVTDEEE